MKIPNHIDWHDLVQQAQRHGYQRGYQDAVVIWFTTGGVLGALLTGLFAVLVTR